MTIRRSPSEFVVKERVRREFQSALAPDRSDARRHAVYELTKESMTTPEAASALARSLGLRGVGVDYAGLKDKHALTTQLMSAPLERDQTHEASLRGERWSARRLGWSDRAVSADVIDGNAFRIIVRDLTPAASAEMDRRARLLVPGPSEPGAGVSLVFINYFGAQRFGSARHGRGFAARRLVEGDFESALRLLIGTPARKDAGKTRAFTRACAQRWGDWAGLLDALPRVPERRAIEVLARGGSAKEAFSALPYFTQQMAVEAYQSHLWNALARRLAGRIAADARTTPLRTPDDFGEMLFPVARLAGPPWHELELPMPAKGVSLEPLWSKDLQAVLREEGLTHDRLTVAGLRRPFFGVSMRPLLVRATSFVIAAGEPDASSRDGSRRERRELTFELPRGSYATVVLRALGQ